MQYIHRPVLNRRSYYGLIFILAFISMLMPLSIDMYLPSMPAIAQDFNVSDGAVQLTISSYLIGFSVGQLIFGPLSDSFGRKPIILIGLLFFLMAAAGCALSQSINQLITLRFFHGLAAAACAVVVNALLRDLFDKDDFSRILSFVTLIMTIAPLLAPILGGILLIWFNWNAIFWTLCLAALIVFILVMLSITETLTKAKRIRFRLYTVLYNFIVLFRHRKACFYMIGGAFSGAGLFSFLSFGAFVYMRIYHVPPQQFGYYFAINIIVLIIMTSINTRFVKQKGTSVMLRLGLTIQFIMALFLIIVTVFDLGFIPLVIGIAGYMGCISMVNSNIMAMLLSDYPYMAGTAASLAGTLRFLVASLVVMVLSNFLTADVASVETETLIESTSKLPQHLMVGSMSMCILFAVIFCYFAHKASLAEKTH